MVTTSINTKSLLKDLSNCHDADQLLNTLKKHGVRDEDWKEFASAATVYSQMSKPEFALAEKFTNMIDTTLISKCYQQGIDPSSERAPKTMKEAIIHFLGIENADLSNLSPRERSILAETCGGLIVTGETGEGAHPTYTFFDYGEGQCPEDFPNTFLKEKDSNKNTIMFVQGRYGQGGHAVLKNCEQGLQLIISKKNPNIPNHKTDDIGFTVTKRFDPVENLEKNPTYKYLTIDGQIPRISHNDSKDLNLLKNGKFDHEWQYGTIIRCFNYKIGKSLGSFNNIDLFQRIRTVFPYCPMPLRIFEEREKPGVNEPHSRFLTMSGLAPSLKENIGTMVEEVCPIEFEFRVDNEDFKVQTYVLTENAKKSSWKGSEGVLFVFNGQSNAYESSTVYSKKSYAIELPYLKDRIITIVETTGLSSRNYHNIFSGNREHLETSVFSTNVQETIYREIKNNVTLKNLNQLAKIKTIKDKTDKTRVISVIQDIVNKFPYLAKLLLKGERINDPTGINPNAGNNFTPKNQPTHFILDPKDSSFLILTMPEKYKLIKI